MIKYSLIILALLFSNLLHAEEPAANITAGKEIFNSYCADACHQAPERSRLRPKQWQVVLNTMQIRMKSAGRVPLTEEQTRQLLDYLSQQD